MPKKCIICGKEFDGGARRKTCGPECSKLHSTAQNRKYAREQYARKKEARGQKSFKRATKKDLAALRNAWKGKTLAEINAEARAQGMTYGKYVAYLKCQEEKRGRGA